MLKINIRVNDFAYTMRLAVFAIKKFLTTVYNIFLAVRIFLLIAGAIVGAVVGGIAVIVIITSVVLVMYCK